MRYTNRPRETKTLGSNIVLRSIIVNKGWIRRSTTTREHVHWHSSLWSDRGGHVNTIYGFGQGRGVRGVSEACPCACISCTAARGRGAGTARVWTRSRVMGGGVTRGCLWYSGGAASRGTRLAWRASAGGRWAGSAAAGWRARETLLR